MFAAAIKFLSLPMFVLPGMISRVLFTGKFIFFNQTKLNIVIDILLFMWLVVVGDRLHANKKFFFFSCALTKENFR